jgi:ribulose-5-phosphate 4-epimerase/fuculose-1-phosphate aldolase
MSSDGFIKFNCTRVEGNINIPEETFEILSKWRQIMYEYGLIGAYSNGIGYGNISVRANNGFYISGTATGRISILEKKHYALVNSYSFAENSLMCTGKINASAESLSHAAIYESLPNVGAVIHVHHRGMWDKYLHSKLTATSPDILYGTPEMAGEIKQIVLTINSEKDSVLIMGGHEEGIIVWGESLDEAGEEIMKYFNLYLAEV